MYSKIFTTAYQNGKAVSSQRIIPFRADPGVENHVVNLYPDVNYQVWDGFGGAITEASGYLYSQMDEVRKKELVNAYFGAGSNHYRMVRIPIDSCDFSLGSYSAMNDPEDIELKNFSLSRAEQYIFPLLEAAQRAAGTSLEIMLTPWSPPPFMKTNGQKTSGGSLKTEYRDLWASYICRYLLEYKRRGFSVRYLTVQNEPKAAQKWDSCQYTAQEEKEFLRDHLYPAMRKNNINDVSICIWDHNKERAFERARDIIDEKMSSMVGGVAFHWYSGDHFDVVSLLRETFPEKKLIFSEGCVEYSHYNKNDELRNAQIYAHDIIGNLNAGMNAFYDWNLVLDQNGGPNYVGNFCDAPVMYHTEQSMLYRKLSYTYIGHFSRYIMPGARRIASSKYTDELEATCFRNPDGTLAAVLLNRTPKVLPVVLRLWGQICEMALPETSICTVNVGNIQ